MLSRVLSRQAGAVARFSTSVARKDLLKDLYLSEIKAFKPRPASEQDAKSVVVPWSIPQAPKAPVVEGAASEVDAYAQEAVEVEQSAVASEETSTSGDWFPIEDVPEASH